MQKSACKGWNLHASNFFAAAKEEIDKSVDFVGRGRTRRFNGVFPFKYTGVVSPSKDILSFFLDSKKPLLDMEDFCLPDLFIWYPEAQYKEFYPDGVPPCKWCNKTTCVMRDGWMPDPRRGHTHTRNVALLGRKYYCEERLKSNIQPCYFRGIDKDVIEQSSDYVKMRWRLEGFDLSHKSAIALSLLRELRGCLIQGLSINGFRQTLLQQQREYHLMLSIQWRSYVDHIRRNPRILMPGAPAVMQQDFAEFDSDAYDQIVPSVAWLIQRVILLMESDGEYKKRRMQMIDGKHLSGDHSFKLTKCVLSGGSKPFTAIYLLMNEFGQIVAWWFTAGTSMAELERAISKIKTRYELYGYDGPLSATTDRCCQERSFWKRVFRIVDSQLDLQYLEAEDFHDIEVVNAPCAAEIASTTAMCRNFVGWISEELGELPIEQRVIIVDGEWKIGHAKMDLLIICMPFSYKVFLFQLSKMCSNDPAKFPRPLKHLLEDSTVKKIGNRICCDVSKLKGWDVFMTPTVDTGHLAADRALVTSRAASLATIIDVLFPGVEIDGKYGGADCPRTSDWSQRELSQEQIKYATNDGYSTAVAYRALMQIMDPKVEARILASEIEDGLKVTFYSNGWKSRIALGTICGSTKTKNKVYLEIDLSANDTIFAPGTLVDVVGSDGTTAKHTIAALQQDRINDAELSQTVTIQAALHFCRRTINRAGEEERIKVNTEKRQVIADRESYNLIHFQNYDADDEGDNPSNNIIESSDSSSAGENDNRRQLPRSIRRRRNFFRRERVKNDIVHVFFRFQRVISKEHGAYYSFITALRDAWFILNQNDLDECFQVLRNKCNLSDREIYRKMKYNFSWFLKRVRRHVPEPPVLERRYMDVYNQYKDIICAKSGKKLFATKEARAAHLSALKHIRRNCVSDVPFECYYSPIRQDRYGLMIYRCHRGTPGNEGIHQKIRQLVRGFNNSPRFMFAILSDYFLIWNQNIDITLRGLPSKYDGVYCGDLLENEIEKMAAWKQRATPPHPDWVSSRSIQCSGETFGFLLQEETSNNMQGDANSDTSSVSVDTDAECAADELCDLDDDAHEAEATMASSLPASSQWMARLCGKFRPYGKVMGNTEWAYFKSNISKFQGRDDNEADNYSSFKWSKMAECWNKWVDSLGTDHPEVTYKSVAYLKAAYKTMDTINLQAATLRPHKQNIDDLRLKHTNDDSNRTFAGEFQSVEPAKSIDPTPMIPEAAQASNDTDSIADASCLTANKSGNKRKKRNRSHRCRRCGKHYALPEWLPFHKNIVPANEDWVANKPGRYLRNGVCNKVWENCTVPESEYEKDFPVKEGQAMPRGPRKKRST